MNEECTVESLNPYDSKSIDRAIHIWANRGSDFSSNTFASNLVFKPLEDDKASWRLLREYLMLDRTNTDWYLCLAQTIVLAFDGLAGRINNNIFSKEIHELPQQNGPELSDITIVNDGNAYSYFTEYAQDLPIPEKYNITWGSKDQIIVNNSLGKEMSISVNLTQTYGQPPQALGYSLLRGDWSNVLPFTGAFRYEGLWDQASSAEITYIPPTIDYNNWISKIESNINVEDVIRPTGLIEEYTLCKEPLEKLAVIYISLILYYDDKI